MRAFRNTILGETWFEIGEAPDWQRLAERREEWTPGTVPAGGLFWTAGADVQKDRIEVDVWAWGRGLEGWLVDHKVIGGGPGDPACWQRLTDLLSRTSQHESGQHLSIARPAIDTGYPYMTRAFHRGLTHLRLQISGYLWGKVGFHTFFFRAAASSAVVLPHPGRPLRLNLPPPVPTPLIRRPERHADRKHNQRVLPAMRATSRAGRRRSIAFARYLRSLCSKRPSIMINPRAIRQKPVIADGPRISSNRMAPIRIAQGPFSRVARLTFPAPTRPSSQ